MCVMIYSFELLKTLNKNSLTIHVFSRRNNNTYQYIYRNAYKINTFFFKFIVFIIFNLNILKRWPSVFSESFFFLSRIDFNFYCSPYWLKLRLNFTLFINYSLSCFLGRDSLTLYHNTFSCVSHFMFIPYFCFVPSYIKWI